MTDTPPPPPPRFLSPKRGRGTKLIQAIHLAAERLGSPLLQWQAMTVDRLARYSGGTPSFPDGLVSVSRQAGKTTLAKAWITGWAELFPGSNMVLIAQTGGDARKRLTELGHALEHSDYYSGQCVIRRGVGNESIRWPNGSELWIAAPTETAVHGSSLDLIIADETWSLPERILGALTPARMARPGSQMLMTSTAGILGRSEIMERFRTLAIGGDDDVGIAEWSCPPDLDVFAESSWSQFMPAFHEPFFDVKGMRRAAVSLSAHDFRRYFGNQWVDAVVEIIGLEDWNAAAALVSPQWPPALAFDVNIPIPGAAIAAAFPADREGNDWHIDLVDHRPGEHVVWMVDRMRELVARHRPVAVFSGGGPIRGIAAEIRQICDDAAIPFRTATLQDHSAAAGLLMEGVRATNVTHADAAPLTAAATKGQPRYSDNGWRFDRQQSTVDVSPVVAASLAYMIGREYHAQSAVFVR